MNFIKIVVLLLILASAGFSQYRGYNKLVRRELYPEIRLEISDTASTTRQERASDIGDSLSQSIRVAAYNASIPDKYLAKYICDGINDEVQIQQAIDFLSNGGSLELTNGDFILTPSSTTSEIITIKDSLYIKAMGNSSVLKVKADAGNYKSILGKTAKLSNFSCDGVIFDHNADNNNLGSDAAYIASGCGRYSITSTQGYDNISLTNNTILNFDGIVSFYFPATSTNGKNITIHNNKFLDVGVNARNIDYDVSVINVGGENGVITNNIINKNDWTIGSARTAIETHIGNAVIANNVIDKFQLGMNITGISHLDDTERTLITGNSINVCQEGMVLWSWQYGTHTTGYGLDGMIISNNEIKIHKDEYEQVSTALGYWGGIRFHGAPTLPARNIKICNNQIEYVEDTWDDYSAVSAAQMALGWYCSGYPGMVFENISFENNTIIGSSQPGIRCEYATIKGMIIKGNTFINCGTTRHPSASDYRRSIILLSPDSLQSDILIKNNEFIDNQDTSQIKYIMYLRSITDSDYAIRVIDNYYSIPSLNSLTNSIYTYGTGYFDFFIKEQGIPDMYRLGWKQVLMGSEIKIDNITYTATSSGDNNVWQATCFGTVSPATGSWYVGDRCIKTDIVVGGYVGWGCTIAGSPGTWRYYGQFYRRSVAGSPVGVSTPIMIGEEIYDNSNGKWYKATGASTSNWTQISN